jgi:hypothetical protein
MLPTQIEDRLLHDMAAGLEILRPRRPVDNVHVTPRAADADLHGSLYLRGNEHKRKCFPARPVV